MQQRGQEFHHQECSGEKGEPTGSILGEQDHFVIIAVFFPQNQCLEDLIIDAF
jgi:hypothetical protein